MYQTELLINPAVKEKFSEVLDYLQKYPKLNVNVKLVKVDGLKFTVEYEKPQHLFNLGRVFEPYQPTKGKGSSFEMHFDNSYINKI